ncbi:unnamed protein product, partial [Discosporangium mesarthrocarpum]
YGHRAKKHRTIAVLEVLNKRAGGVFGEADERALMLLCSTVETLLLQKAAEVTLMRNGLADRSRGGERSTWEGGRSSSARIENALLRLYSK